jgi:hypothetical protein
VNRTGLCHRVSLSFEANSSGTCNGVFVWQQLVCRIRNTADVCPVPVLARRNDAFCPFPKGGESSKKGKKWSNPHTLWAQAAQPGSVVNRIS